MTTHATHTPPGQRGHRRLWNPIKWPVLIGLAIAAMFLTGIYARGGEAATSPTLGTADSFSILAGTEITNVPTSAIGGDVGLSPATGANIGLSCAEVTGSTYSVDAFGPSPCAETNPSLLTTAKSDLSDTYDALVAGDNAACTVDYGNVVVDLAGLSLVPGVYCTDVTGTTGAFTLSGTLTLQGSGVWIFRSGSTLITSGTANVVGGDPCDVWWRVPSSATLGTDTDLVGNILALTSISLQTGATLDGRALAQNAAVSLDSNTITTTACSAASTPVPATGTPSPTPAATSTGTATSSPAATSTPAATSSPAATFTPATTSTPGSSTPTAVGTQGTPGSSGLPPQSPISPPQTGSGGLLQPTRTGVPLAEVGVGALLLLIGLGLARQRIAQGTSLSD